jgi:hypothetical protein
MNKRLLLLLAVSGGVWWWLRSQKPAHAAVTPKPVTPTPSIQPAPPPPAIPELKPQIVKDVSVTGGQVYKFNLPAKEWAGMPDSPSDEWEVDEITSDGKVSLYSWELDMDIIVKMSDLQNLIGKGDAKYVRTEQLAEYSI